MKIGAFIGRSGGVNDLMKEALMSTEYDVETNANLSAKLWPNMPLKSQASKHVVG